MEDRKAGTVEEAHLPCPTRWAMPALSAILLVVLIGLFYGTAQSMLMTWLQAETYTHGILILPLFGWLLWRSRKSWGCQSITPCFTAILPLAASGAAWMLATLVDVQVVQHFALVSIFVSAFVVVMGTAISRTLAFPLAYLFFAVPMGEALVPPLMEYTATVTTLLVKLSGIPVYRDGMFISLPSGNWSVVQACSGIRYLIASLALGCLFAYINYSSIWKRLGFIAISAIVPILANGLRAYMIVMIGHLSDMQLAVGVDHLIYGWLFFGLVMFILFLIGSRWRDPDPEPVAEARTDTVGNLSWSSTALALVLVLGLSTLWPSWVYAMNHVQRSWGETPLSVPAELKGWRQEPSDAWEWYPRSSGEDRLLDRFYQREAPGATTVSLRLHVANYLAQQQGKEVVNVNNRLFHREFRYWRVASQQLRNVQTGELNTKVNEAIIRGPGQELLAWQWYRVGDYYTADKYMAKVREAMSRLFKGRRDASIITVAIPIDGPDEDQRLRAGELLADFVAEMLPELESSLDRGMVNGADL